MNTKGRILVVEDYSPLLHGLQELLEREGYTIFIAVEGEQAIEMMGEVQPDLIISGLLLPKMDGCSLCVAIHVRQEWSSIPFIMISSQSQRRFISEAQRAGADDYIVKPFDPQALAATIHTQLSQTGPSPMASAEQQRGDTPQSFGLAGAACGRSS